MKPTYLGDSVYIKETAVSPLDLSLYLNNGEPESEFSTKIILDDQVAYALHAYITKHRLEHGLSMYPNHL